MKSGTILILSLVGLGAWFAFGKKSNPLEPKPNHNNNSTPASTSTAINTMEGAPPKPITLVAEGWNPTPTGIKGLPIAL